MNTKTITLKFTVAENGISFESVKNLDDSQDSIVTMEDTDLEQIQKLDSITSELEDSKRELVHLRSELTNMTDKSNALEYELGKANLSRRQARVLIGQLYKKLIKEMNSHKKTKRNHVPARKPSYRIYKNQNKKNK